MSYQDAVGYLYSLQKFGMKFGLDNTRRLMALFDGPHHAFRCIHVAGTNGKGSTAAMIESILRTGGCRTGLFTSPHLVNFTERIRVDGQEISEKEVASLANEVREAAEGISDFSPTFFEVVTTMAFLHFRRMPVDWAVIETGLGGRLDATNVITPEVSVITMIDYDHREFLGSTLGDIAREKAGIIKPGRPVVSADQRPEVMEVLREKALLGHSRLFVYRDDFSSEIGPDSSGPLKFSYKGTGTYPEISLPLAGLHQVTNASLAAKTVEVLQERDPSLRLDIAGGIGRVKWPGRLEMISSDPPILIDGAHNPHASASLSLYLKGLLGNRFNRIIMVLGVMGDKDVSGILAPLLPLASEIIATAPSYGRAASPGSLSETIASLGYAARTSLSVAEAIAEAKDLCRPGDVIVITGSFYTIGEAREVLGHPGILTRLRE